MRTSTFLSSLLGYIKKLFRNAIFQILSLVVALGSIGITYAAWTTITVSQGASGQPVNQTLVQGIINNINDLDTRISTFATNLTTLTTKVVAINPSGTNIAATDINLSGNVRTSNGNGYYVNAVNYYGDTSNAAIRMPGALYIQNQAGSQLADIFTKNVNASTICINGDCKTAWPNSYGGADCTGATTAGANQNGLQIYAINQTFHNGEVWLGSPSQFKLGLYQCVNGVKTWRSTFMDFTPAG